MPATFGRTTAVSFSAGLRARAWLVALMGGWLVFVGKRWILLANLAQVLGTAVGSTRIFWF